MYANISLRAFFKIKWLPSFKISNCILQQHIISNISAGPMPILTFPAITHKKNNTRCSHAYPRIKWCFITPSTRSHDYDDGTDITVPVLGFIKTVVLSSLLMAVHKLLIGSSKLLENAKYKRLTKRDLLLVVLLVTNYKYLSKLLCHRSLWIERYYTSSNVSYNIYIRNIYKELKSWKEIYWKPIRSASWTLLASSDPLFSPNVHMGVALKGFPCFEGWTREYVWQIVCWKTNQYFRWQKEGIQK